MMNLEERISQTVAEFLESDAIEQKINAQIEKAIDGAMDELFSGYRAPVKKVIEEKLKEQMVPAIEKYDFSRYIVKLDKTLTEVLKNTTVENKTIIENFAEFTTFKKPEKVSLSEIFDKYLKYVGNHVDTTDLEIDFDFDFDFDDEPTYEDVGCCMEFDLENDRWSFSSSFEYANVIFSCEADKKLDMKLRLSRFREGDWKIIGNNFSDIGSLRTLSEFEIFLINLSTHEVAIEIDEEVIEDVAEVDERPEPTY